MWECGYAQYSAPRLCNGDVPAGGALGCAHRTRSCPPLPPHSPAPLGFVRLGISTLLVACHPFLLGMLLGLGSQQTSLFGSYQRKKDSVTQIILYV